MIQKTANLKNPDIRMRSSGAAELYGMMPLTEAGKEFVAAFSQQVPGQWNDETFWFNDRFMPSRRFKDRGLKIVAGIGTTDEFDSPW